MNLAEQAFSEAVRLAPGKFSDTDGTPLVIEINLAATPVDLERCDEAVEHARNVHQRRRPRPGAIEADLFGYTYGGALSDAGRFAEGLPLIFKAAQAIADTPDRFEPPTRLQMFTGLLRRPDRWEQAEPGHGHADEAAHWRSVGRRLGLSFGKSPSKEQGVERK